MKLMQILNTKIVEYYFGLKKNMIAENMIWILQKNVD